VNTQHPSPLDKFTVEVSATEWNAMKQELACLRRSTDGAYLSDLLAKIDRLSRKCQLLTNENRAWREKWEKRRGQSARVDVTKPWDGTV